MFILKYIELPTARPKQVGQTPQLSDAIWLASLVVKQGHQGLSKATIFEAGNSLWSLDIGTDDTNQLVILTPPEQTPKGSQDILDEIEQLPLLEQLETLKSLKTRCPNKQGRQPKQKTQNQRVLYRLTTEEHNALRAHCQPGESVNQCAKRLALAHAHRTMDL